MPPATSAPSLEPYLRARAVNPTLIPSNTPRTLRQREVDIDKGDFADFLNRVIKLAITPITLPARLIKQTVTSPLTVSLVIRLVLLAFLTLASAVFSVLAVGAFWWSWSSGGAIELEGWLTYGSRNHRTPHTLISLPGGQIQEDLRYDVEVELELVRPSRGSEEMGNFMLSVELRSLRTPGTVVIAASQPSLPPPPLPSSLIGLPSFPTYLLPPCVLPWPLRSFCPSRVFGYDEGTRSRLRQRRKRGGYSSPARGKDVVLLRKELMDGVILKPSNGGEGVVGAAFVSIGRDDVFSDESSSGQNCNTPSQEVRTTGWVIIRLIPRPTGVRWLLSSHPLPPLLLLPPVSLTLTLSSSLFAFIIISFLTRSRTPRKAVETKPATNPMSEEALLAERTRRAFKERDLEEREEQALRREEWEEVESRAEGLRRMPEERKRSVIGASTIGGSETTAPSAVRSFGPIPDELETSSEADETASTVTETATESVATAESFN